ncbi:MAG: DUF6273 domain-containing protein [Coriobacteriales bacterium]|jgi:hypothetical protein|nr:DUF6273 domain-containing protein [Coriobacteriales bacterium]
MGEKDINYILQTRAENGWDADEANLRSDWLGHRKVDWWWLRSSGEDGLHAVYINDVGDIETSGTLVYHNAGVRPAMWVMLNAAETGETSTSLASQQDLIQNGDEVAFGQYGGQSIIWQCLAVEDDWALLLSREILFESSYIAPDFYGDQNLLEWADSDIRTTLNNAFLSDFSDDDLAKVKETQINGYRESTVDRVFLLSEDEAYRYLPNAKDREARYHGVPTKWFLKSDGAFEGYRICVYEDGSIPKVDGGGVFGTAGVRPALWLSLQS